MTLKYVVKVFIIPPKQPRQGRDVQVLLCRIKLPSIRLLTVGFYGFGQTTLSVFSKTRVTPTETSTELPSVGLNSEYTGTVVRL